MTVGSSRASETSGRLLGIFSRGCDQLQLRGSIRNSSDLSFFLPRRSFPQHVMNNFRSLRRCRDSKFPRCPRKPFPKTFLTAKICRDGSSPRNIFGEQKSLSNCDDSSSRDFGKGLFGDSRAFHSVYREQEAPSRPSRNLTPQENAKGAEERPGGGGQKGASLAGQ